jgi:regulator of protease activity HflC (stomatin/prohibitin superfamily)
VRLAFWFVVAIALLAAGAWATSNVRRIPADSRAVVMRFGAFVRTQDAGLLIAMATTVRNRAADSWQRARA